MKIKFLLLKLIHAGTQIRWAGVNYPRPDRVNERDRAAMDEVHHSGFRFGFVTAIIRGKIEQKPVEINKQKRLNVLSSAHLKLTA